MLDVRIPELDGPATLVEMRKLPECSDTPVIFMTANVTDRDLQQYISLGALDVIEKPFDPMELSDRLRALSADSPNR